MPQTPLERAQKVLIELINSGKKAEAEARKGFALESSMHGLLSELGGITNALMPVVKTIGIIENLRNPDLERRLADLENQRAALEARELARLGDFFDKIKQAIGHINSATDELNATIVAVDNQMSSLTPAACERVGLPTAQKAAIALIGRWGKASTGWKQAEAQYQATTLMKFRFPIALKNLREVENSHDKSAKAGDLSTNEKALALATAQQDYIREYDQWSAECFSGEQIDESLFTFQTEDHRKATVNELRDYIVKANEIRLQNLKGLIKQLKSTSDRSQILDSIVGELDALAKYQNHLIATADPQKKPNHINSRTHLESVAVTYQMRALQAKADAAIDALVTQEEMERDPKTKARLLEKRALVQKKMSHLEEALSGMADCFGEFDLAEMDEAITRRTALPMEHRQVMHETLETVFADLPAQYRSFKETTDNDALQNLFGKMASDAEMLTDRARAGLPRVDGFREVTPGLSAEILRKYGLNKLAHQLDPLSTPAQLKEISIVATKPKVFVPEDAPVVAAERRQSVGVSPPKGAGGKQADLTPLGTDSPSSEEPQENLKDKADFSENDIKLLGETRYQLQLEVDGAKRKISLLEQDVFERSAYTPDDLKSLCLDVAVKCKAMADISSQLALIHHDFAESVEDDQSKRNHKQKERRCKRQQEASLRDVDDFKRRGEDLFWLKKEENLIENLSDGAAQFRKIPNNRITSVATIKLPLPGLARDEYGKPIPNPKSQIGLSYDHISARTIEFASGLRMVIDLHYRSHLKHGVTLADLSTKCDGPKSATFKLEDDARTGSTEASENRGVFRDPLVAQELANRLDKLQKQLLQQTHGRSGFGRG